MMYRQGDVLLQKIDSIPKGAIVKDNVLAKGEITGHSHRIVGNTQTYIMDGQQFVMVNEASVLQHEEHKPITVPKGMYKVRIQREYTLTEEVRQVTD